MTPRSPHSPRLRMLMERQLTLVKGGPPTPMMQLKDIRALLEQIRRDKEMVLKEVTDILREIGYYPAPLRSASAKRISTGLIRRPSPVPGTHPCPTCQRVFKYPNHLARHRQTAHPPSPAPAPAKVKPR
jgi:hypothetical protein